VFLVERLIEQADGDLGAVRELGEFARIALEEEAALAGVADLELVHHVDVGDRHLALQLDTRITPPLAAHRAEPPRWRSSSMVSPSSVPLPASRPASLPVRSASSSTRTRRRSPVAVEYLKSAPRFFGGGTTRTDRPPRRSSSPTFLASSAPLGA